jgi:hypothetical protein
MILNCQLNSPDVLVIKLVQLDMGLYFINRKVITGVHSLCNLSSSVYADSSIAQYWSGT